MSSRFAFLLVGLMVLSGCRARDEAKKTFDEDEGTLSTGPAPTGEDTSSGSNRPTKAARDGRPLIVCFGDSLTAGYGTEAGQSYPDYLQADLDAKGYHYQVLNEGVSGATTKDGVERLAEIVDLKPEIVVVEFGGNDGLRGLPVKDMRTNLDTIVKGLQKSGAKVVLAGIILPPDYGPDYVSQFVGSYPLVAGRYHVPLLPFLLKDVFGISGMMQKDRTHATAKGNIIVAQNVLPVVLPLLKR